MTAQTANTENREYKLIPEGEYVLSLNRVNPAKISENSGNEYVSISFQIDDPTEGSEINNRLLFEVIMLSCASNPKVVEYSQNKVNRFLKTFDSSLEDLGHDLSRLSDFIGKKFIGKVSMKLNKKTGKVDNAVTAFKKR